MNDGFHSADSETGRATPRSRTSLEHDFQIKQDRHVFEIEQIHHNHLVGASFFFVYLPVSGQARQTVYAFPLPGLIMSKFIWRAGPRTD